MPQLEAVKPGRPDSRLLTEGSIFGALVRISIPIVLANILQVAYQLTDMYWVGKLSAEASAAVALSFPITFLMVAIGSGLAIAGSVLIAQYMGRGEERAMNHVTAQTLIMVTAISVILSTVGYALSEPIVRFMGADQAVLPIAVQFIRITFIGFIFVFGFFVYQSLMRGLGVVQIPMLIVLLTVILNFALDPLFIYGWGPIPPLGAGGAAMATLLTQALAAVIGFVLLFSGKHGLHPRLADFRPDWAVIYKTFKLGLPASVDQGTRALNYALMTQLVARFGTVALAAYGIGTRILTFVVIPAMGLSMATTTLVAQNLGAGKLERAEETNLLANLLSFLVPTVGGALLFIFATPLATVFVPRSPEAIAESAHFIRILSLPLGFVGVQFTISGTLRGAGNTLAAMVLTIIAAWVLQFPLAYVLSQHTSLGLDGIWWSNPVSAILAAIVSVVWFAGGDWKRTKLLDDLKLEQRVLEEARIEEGIAT
jgi:putative MATE family efflux protein